MLKGEPFTTGLENGERTKVLRFFLKSLNPADRPKLKKKVLEVIKTLQEVLITIPRFISQVLTLYSISISRTTGGKLLRSIGFSYKRSRQSCKFKQNPEKVAKAKKEISDFQSLELEGKVDLYYFDETGFNLRSNVPYTWGPKNFQERRQSKPSKTHTLLGFMSKSKGLKSYRFNASADSEVFISCVEEFIVSMSKEKRTIVILDNASIHKSKVVVEKMAEWKEQGLEFYFLPPYSPELNLIERLWLEIKYRWIDKKAFYDSIDELMGEVDKKIKLFNKGELSINWT